MTSLRKSIEISQKMSQYDTFAKRILADRQVLSRIKRDFFMAQGFCRHSWTPSLQSLITTS